MYYPIRNDKCSIERYMVGTGHSYLPIHRVDVPKILMKYRLSLHSFALSRVLLLMFVDILLE